MNQRLSEARALAVLLVQAKSIVQNKFKQNRDPSEAEKTLTADLINLADKRIESLTNDDRPFADDSNMSEHYNGLQKRIDDTDACGSLRGLHHMLQDTLSDEERLKSCIEKLFIMVHDCIGNNGQNVYDAADALSKLAYAGVE